MAPLVRWEFHPCQGPYYGNTRAFSKGRMGILDSGTDLTPCRLSSHYWHRCRTPYASRSFSLWHSYLAPETAESFAIHQAVKWALTATEPVVIHFDCKAFGRDAEATYAPTALSSNIVRASRGPLQRREHTGAHITFAHTKGHAWNAFNQIVDYYAKAGAHCFICTQIIFTLASEWYSTDSPVAE